MVKIVDDTAIIIIKRSHLKHKRGIKRGLMAAATPVKRDAVFSLVYPLKTGRVYSFNGYPHQASAPGEPPANMSGRLANSIKAHTVGDTRLLLAATTDYAGYLEYGTSRMAARPFIRRTGNRMIREVEQYILREVAKELGKK